MTLVIQKLTYYIWIYKKIAPNRSTATDEYLQFNIYAGILTTHIKGSKNIDYKEQKSRAIVNMIVRSLSRRSRLQDKMKGLL